MRPEQELRSEVCQMIAVLNYTKIPILNMERKIAEYEISGYI